MNNILDDKFFNLHIHKDLENLLIVEANSIMSPSSVIKSAQDIEIIICSFFIDGVGFVDTGRDLLKVCYRILIQYTDYPTDLIFHSICKYLYGCLLRILEVEWYNNVQHDHYFLTYKKDQTSNILFAKNSFSEKYSFEILLKKNLNGFLPIAVADALAETKRIETDLQYSDELIQIIKNTRTKLLQINSYLKDGDLEHLINQMPTGGQQVKTLLKKIKNSKCNYLCCDEDAGLVYMHIINIIFAVFNIKREIKKEMKIKGFLHMSESEKSGLYFHNILKNLISFKKKVNINQILQYVSVYYYENMLCDDCDDCDDIDKFNNFKNLIANLFNRNPSKLFKNKLDIAKIDRPFNFLYYHRWEILSERREVSTSSGELETVPIGRRLDCPKNEIENKLLKGNTV